MENIVTRSKFVNETISIVFDFSDQLSSGESISSCTIIVSLFTGIDNDPSNILYQTPTITGTKVDQKFRLGIPGCIYEISFLVFGSSGAKVEKCTNLAILPQDGTAIPSFTVVYETSCLYPYEYAENVKHTFSWSAGKMLGIKYSEAVTHDFSWLTGSANGALKNYKIPPESITQTFEWLSGALNGTLVSYRNPPESISMGFAWISGNLDGTFIGYRNPPESMNHTLDWTSGSLV